MQLPFHNSVSTTGAFDGYDFADWDFSVAGDAFGSAGPSSPGYISETDLQVMNVLGWIYGIDEIIGTASADTIDAAHSAMGQEFPTDSSRYHLWDGRQ